MKNQKMYEGDDKMISIIRDNYNILQSLGRLRHQPGLWRQDCVRSLRRTAGGYLYFPVRG